MLLHLSPTRWYMKKKNVLTPLRSQERPHYTINNLHFICYPRIKKLFSSIKVLGNSNWLLESLRDTIKTLRFCWSNSGPGIGKRSSAHILLCKTKFALLGKCIRKTKHTNSHTYKHMCDIQTCSSHRARMSKNLLLIRRPYFKVYISNRI